MPTRTGPPTVGGRWSILPIAETDATLRAHAQAETLLDRYGVVTRGAVMNEGWPGGFALPYKVLSGFEETGRARRGYFVETLGAAQFATAATVDRLRSFTIDHLAEPPLEAVALAATDPANPYGAALPWPSAADPGDEASGSTTGAGPGSTGHRAGRKAGALVVLVDGALVLYAERGGKSLLSFVADRDVLGAAASALARLVTQRRVDKLSIETVNGAFILGTPVGDALSEAGFTATPRGLRLRS